MRSWRDDITEHARTPETSGENCSHLLCAHQTSQAKGIEFLGRFMARTEDRNPPTSLALREAQYEAIVERGIPDHGALQRLTAIGCPTPDHQGDGDLMISASLSHVMAGLTRDAQIRVSPDAAHAFRLQEPEQVAADVNAFLASPATAS
jgi:pimeloyl-ACP methyl ester carboxylesterase